MPRIAKPDVHSALLRASNHIKDAAKNDGIASREDIKEKLKDLDGVEKNLVGIFYRFIDHRDAVPGARVTAKDIDKAVDYAKDKLIDAYDLNNNGLSKDEIAQMSRTGQLAVQLAKEMKAAAPKGRGPEALSDGMKKAAADGLLKLEWQNGFIQSATVSTKWNNEGLSTLDQMNELFSLPEAQHIKSLNIGLMGDDGMSEYADAIKAMSDAGPLSNLSQLTIGDYQYPDQTEISWVSVGDITPVFEAAPNLEELTVRGGDVILSPIEHDSLTSLTIESGGLPGEVAQALSSSKLPNCADLEVWFGSDEYGADTSPEMLDGLLKAEGFPKLTNLGLMNAEFQNDIVKNLVDSPLLAQIKTLDLSMGTMTDDYAKVIIDNPEKFGHLTELNLDENYISEDLANQIKGALGDEVVSIGDQKEYDEYDEYYYVSVSE